MLGSGIGRQLCLAYARSGCEAIALADIRIEGVRETISLIQAEQNDVQTLAIEVNVANASSVKDMLSRIIEVFGRIDYGLFPKFTIECGTSHNFKTQPRMLPESQQLLEFLPPAIHMQSTTKSSKSTQRES